MNAAYRMTAACTMVFAMAFAVYGVDQFITGGWPVAESSVSAYSAAATIVSGRLSSEGAGGALDARFRSELGSEDEIAFDSFAPKGFVIIVR